MQRKKRFNSFVSNLCFSYGGQGWSATGFAVGVRNSDELLGYEPLSGVPYLAPAKKNARYLKRGQGGVRRSLPSAFAILTNCSATNHRAVFLGSPLPKKILAIQNAGRGGVREASLSATGFK